MIIVDSALRKRQEEGRPVRVAISGAGAMGRGIAHLIVNSVPGMELVAIANRTLETAQRAFREAGVDSFVEAESAAAPENAIASGRPAVTEDATLLGRVAGVDAVVEVTGHVEHSAGVVLQAIEGGKHVVLMNAELDATVGPILKTYADRAGVVYTTSDGDQPGVIMNLVRFVRGIGMTPLVLGNIKGMQDRYRTPTTQAEFARKWNQGVDMVTSFADGTKISFEQAVVANATGMGVAQRGMTGLEHTGHVDELTDRFDVASLRARGGIVEYVIGANPGPGVFVFAAQDDPSHRHYLNLYKLGEGPLYSFYTPYHLCYFEAPSSVARAVLFGDAVGAPLGGPVVEVVAAAKRDLRAGEALDGIGRYMTYGLCENADAARRERLLPMGIAEGCILKRDVPRDAVISYDDVDVPAGRLIDRLRAEQDARFPVTTTSARDPMPATATR